MNVVLGRVPGRLLQEDPEEQAAQRAARFGRWFHVGIAVVSLATLSILFAAPRFFPDHVRGISWSLAVVALLAIAGQVVGILVARRKVRLPDEHLLAAYRDAPEPVPAQAASNPVDLVGSNPVDAGTPTLTWEAVE